MPCRGKEPITEESEEEEVEFEENNDNNNGNDEEYEQVDNDEMPEEEQVVALLILLLFPNADAARPFSMLGLGDIVIPGIFVALALRFDVSRGTKIRYFNSAFLGYTVGLTVTIVVMNWFQAAQPALLYIVPGVIGFVAVHCLWNGEVKPLLEYNESKAEVDEAGEEDDTNQSKKVD